MTDTEHYIGHRKRLRHRLLKSAHGGLPDYEILELILCMAITRADVKPLSKLLLQEYGSLAKVLTASSDSLLQVRGVGESVVAAFRIIQEASARLIKEEVLARPIIESWRALLDYCRTTMGHLKTEQFRVIFLDNKNMVIFDELLNEGTVNHVSVYPREVIKRALYLEASSIILVHNHPSGNTKPSSSDLDLTKEIVQAASTLGIIVHDHVIISSKNHYSFKSNGIM